MQRERRTEPVSGPRPPRGPQPGPRHRRLNPRCSIPVRGCTITSNGETRYLACSCPVRRRLRQIPSEKLTALSEDFVYASLAFSPSSATAAGLHQYKKQNLDDMLDDFSAAEPRPPAHVLSRSSATASPTSSRPTSPPKTAPTSPSCRTRSRSPCSISTEIHSHLHSPQFTWRRSATRSSAPYVLEYAPKPDRIRHIIARLQKVPLYLDQASTNLVSSPAIWTQVATEENQGNIALVDKEDPRRRSRRSVRRLRPRRPSRAGRHDASSTSYLKNSLSSRDNYNWRLGGEHLHPQVPLRPAKRHRSRHTLQQAERELTAGPRPHAGTRPAPAPPGLPSHKDHADLAGADRENTVDRRSPRQNRRPPFHAAKPIMDDARKDLDEARAFVQEKHLLTLPPRANLQVIPTPEFMRGIYSVGGFNPAPALEPQLGAFYWVTPIPPTGRRSAWNPNCASTTSTSSNC